MGAANATTSGVQRLGWDCRVAPVSLPPLPKSGRTDWTQFLTLPSGVMIVVLRTELVEKSAQEQPGIIADLMAMLASCTVRPPLFYNNARGVQLESAIMTALERSHVASQVRVIGAVEFYEA